MNTYTVTGTTDENLTCDICGRMELSHTVVLETGDEVVYAGSGCAAKLAGKPVREIKAEAKAADTAKKEEMRAAKQAAYRAQIAKEDAWLAEHGLTRCLATLREYREELAAL